METSAMATFLADAALVMTQLLTWVTSIATTIVGTPILAISVILLLCGAAVGFVSRLIGIR